MPAADNTTLPAVLSDPADLPARPGRILVAEDEHLVAADLTLILAEQGHTSMLAADGRAAVELARTGRPDLALVDVRMPEGDGLWAAAELYYGMGIPVVVHSAYCDDDLLEEAQDAGVFGYLVKPVRPNQLRAGLALAWGRYRLYCAERLRNVRLQRRLDERRVIEKAKWAMVSTMGITEPDAMRLLQKRARSARRPLAEMAEQVLRESGGEGG